MQYQTPQPRSNKRSTPPIGIVAKCSTFKKDHPDETDKPGKAVWWKQQTRQSIEKEQTSQKERAHWWKHKTATIQKKERKPQHYDTEKRKST